MKSEQLIRILQKNPGKDVLIAPDGHCGAGAYIIDDVSAAFIPKEAISSFVDEVWEKGDLEDEDNPTAEPHDSLREVVIIFGG